MRSRTQIAFQRSSSVMLSRLARRFGPACVLALAVFSSGCDRGSLPEQLGRPAPQFSINDGVHAVNLRDLRGQVVVLNFWASWCAPCVAEMPSLEQLQQEVPAIKIVAVAFDQDAASYNAFLQRRPLPIFTVLDANGTANAAFGTFRPPETYVIDKQGIIRRKYIGSQDWTSPEIVNSLRRLAG